MSSKLSTVKHNNYYVLLQIDVWSANTTANTTQIVVEM